MILAAAIALCALIPGSAAAYPDSFAGSFGLPGLPSASVLSSSGRFVYISGSAGRTLMTADLLRLETVSELSMPGAVSDMALSRDGKNLYVVTDLADEVGVVDVSASPGSPSDVSALDLGTSGVTFDSIAVAGESGAQVLVLGSRGKQAVFLFDLATERIRTIGSLDRIELSYEPKALDVTPDGSRLAVISTEGDFEVYSAASFSLTGALDIGALTEDAIFTSLHIAEVDSGTVAFVLNASDPGEVYLISVSASASSPTFLDADPGMPGVTPVFVGPSPSSLTSMSVLRANAGKTSALYLYVANSGDSTLSVIDTADVAGGEAVKPISTIQDAGSVSERGLSPSSAVEGYLYAADRASRSIRVVTDQPWLEVVSAPTAPVGDDGTQVVIRSSSAGTLEVCRYTLSQTEPVATGCGSGRLASVSIDADTDTAVSFSTASLEEGRNLIAFFLSSGPYRGRTASDIVRDTDPPTPSRFRLSFGDRKIIADWDRVTVADMSHYLVHFGVSEPDGGLPGMPSPLRADQPSSGGVRRIIEPIENGTTLFVRVVAVDTAGNQSPPTETLFETAEATVGPIELSGERGGCRAPGSSSFILIILAVISLLFRFKRFRAVSVFLIAIPTASVAGEPLMRTVPPSDIRLSAEFRGGFWVPKDANLKRFLGRFGNEAYSLRFGVGRSFFDAGLGVGLTTEKGRLEGATSGRVSGETFRLTLVPIDFSAQIDLSLQRSPVVVPLGRLSYDLVCFNLSEPEVSRSGVKHAVSMAALIRVNLSRFSAGNDLEDMLGIRALYLEGAASYRHQFTGGLDFGGWTFQPGLAAEF